MLTLNMQMLAGKDIEVKFQWARPCSFNHQNVLVWNLKEEIAKIRTFSL